ncbi:MFS transporter [Bartonella tamiae]|uniref:MFS transporter n=1 Tax=Bartonella tamiae TaxID=373638 RepID=UPI000310B5EC|nr:MFS transporter [Bartonella tamiae]
MQNKYNKPIKPSENVSQRDVIAVAIGNAVEFYDFIVYTTFAVMIGQTFFPSENPLSSLLFSVTAFGVGFVARPLGAIFIGAYADKSGRKPAMLLTMFLMAAGTGGLVILPGYETIGIFAPIMLLVMRFAQGLAWGGEAGPATTFILESAPKNRRAFYTSWQMVAQGGAAIAAGLIGTILSLILQPEQFQNWGWRIAIAAGLTILPIAFYMRRHLHETHRQSDKTQSFSAKTILNYVFKNYPMLIIAGIFILSGSTITQYFLNYLTTYALTELHFGESLAMVTTVFVGFVMITFALIGGLCADYYGRAKTIIIPRLFLLILLWPGLYLINTSENILVFFTVIGIFTALQNISGAGIVVLLCESFPKTIRSTGFSLSYTFGITIFGGTAQIIISWLLKVTENPLSPAFYLIIGNVMTLCAIFCAIKKNYFKSYD